jgi:hypothetical protein
MWREEVGQNPTAQRMVKVEVKVGINDVMELLFNPSLVVIEACEASRWFGGLECCCLVRQPVCLVRTVAKVLVLECSSNASSRTMPNVFQSLFAGYKIVVQLRF